MGLAIHDVMGAGVFTGARTTAFASAKTIAPSVTPALPALLPTLLPQLWRFALRLARHTADAQDLVQRTCVRALERQHQWQPQGQAEGSPLSWLYAVMHSIWLNEMRSRRLHPVDSLTVDADGDLDNHRDAAEAQIVDTQARDPSERLHFTQVVRAVESLPDAQRVVMLLVAVEGLSYREAADVLEVPLGTVMSRLARARLVIGQRFAEPGQRGQSHVA
jgi:RNA polymerase sigma-70 factor, ECF subfamily